MTGRELATWVGVTIVMIVVATFVSNVLRWTN